MPRSTHTRTHASKGEVFQWRKERGSGEGWVLLISRALVFTQRVNYRLRSFTSPFELEFHLPFLRYLWWLETKCEIRIFSISRCNARSNALNSDLELGGSARRCVLFQLWNILWSWNCYWSYIITFSTSILYVLPNSKHSILRLFVFN